MRANSFDILKIMGERNLDIRGFPLGENLVSANSGKKRATITMTVNPETVHDLLVNNPIRGMLIIFDVSQFDAIKSELEQEAR